MDTHAVDDGFVVVGSDGAQARGYVPFPPLAGTVEEHLRIERTVGVVLVRLGNFAVGIFAGVQLVESKVDSRLVHGRASAGGWSQKRFARRREGQERASNAAAADVAARILTGKKLDAVVTGGDRRAVDAVLADRRLESLRPLVSERFLTVPDPKRAVLERSPEQFLAVRIRISDP